VVTATRQYVPTEEDLRQLKAYESFPDFLPYIHIEAPNEEGVEAFKPYPYQLELAKEWDEGQDQIILKARQIGCSTLVAAYALWVAIHPGEVVLMFSLGQDEAKRLLRKSRKVWEHLPPGVLKPPLEVGNTEMLEFADAGTIIAYPSTENAGSGERASLVIVDEAAKHPYARENYGAYQPTLSRGGQFLMLSTAKAATGQFFKEMWEDARDGKNPYRAKFLPWTVSPEYDAKWLELTMQRFAHDPELFKEEFPLSAEDAFVVREGLVYKEFSRQQHVVADWEWATPGKKGVPCKWEDCKYRYAGVDFGSSMPSAIVCVGVTGTGRIHVFGEYYKRGGADLLDMGLFLKDWDKRGRFNRILCDPSESSSYKTFQSMGLGVADAANNDKVFGIQMVKTILKSDRLTVADCCTNLIKEFGEYREGTRTNPNSKEKYPTRTPVDHHADALDGFRYVICEIMEAEGWRDIYNQPRFHIRF